MTVEFDATIDKALYKLTLILDTLNWHPSIMLSYTTHLSHTFLVLCGKAGKCTKNYMCWNLPNVRTKCTRGRHVPTKICLCSSKNLNDISVIALCENAFSLDATYLRKFDCHLVHQRSLKKVSQRESTNKDFLAMKFPELKK